MTSPSIDGSAEQHTWAGASTFTTSGAGLLTTSAAGMIVAIVGFNRSAAAASVTAITSTSGLVFTRRYTKSEPGSNHDKIEMWTAPSAGAKTNEAVTVTTDLAVNAGAVCVFGVKDVFSTATPFDPNAGLPYSNTATGTGNPVVTYSTSKANDLLIFNQAGDKSGAGAGLTGFTTLFNTTNGSGAGAFFGMSVAWKSVAAIQSAVPTAGQTGNASANAVAAVDAFTHDSAGETGTAGMDFGGISFNSSGSHGFTGSAVMAFGGIAFLATGGVSPPRVTQATRLIPASGGGDARATQIPRLLVAGVHADARATQAVRLIVADRVQCVTRWTQLWRITRRDGEVFRYTALDEDFLWGTETFKTCGSLQASAAQDVSAVGQVSSQELQGIFKDDGITEAALYGGLFDDAFVEVWLVAYEGTESPRRLAAGWTGNLSHEEGTFNMEVVGPGAKIDQQALVQVYGPGCRWVFGSPQCGYDREARKITGTVTASLSRGSFIGQAETGSSGSAELSSDEGALQWADGLVRWITGPNAGIECEVKTADFESGGIAVELWDLAAFLPGPGDEFELLPGCDLSFPTCRDVYHNAINFGGFKDVPGEDAVMQTPDAKVDS